MEKLLNWDHDVIPTPLEDLFENICTVSHKFTGRAARVRVEGKSRLVIEQLIPEKKERTMHFAQGAEFVSTRVEAEYWKTAVVLNLHYHGREMMGRLHYILGNVNCYTLGMYVDKDVNKFYHENM